MTGFLLILAGLAIGGVVAAATVMTRSPRAYKRTRAITGRLPVPARTSTGQARGRAARRGRHRAGAAR